MDEKLLNALEVGKLLDTVNRHKKILYNQYIEDSTIYYNGGRFIADAKLISFIAGSDPKLILDQDNIPIEINDTEDFVTKIISQYQTAIAKYHSRYTEISKTIRDNSV